MVRAGSAGSPVPGGVGNCVARNVVSVGDLGGLGVGIYMDGHESQAWANTVTGGFYTGIEMRGDQPRVTSNTIISSGGAFMGINYSFYSHRRVGVEQHGG